MTNNDLQNVCEIPILFPFRSCDFFSKDRRGRDGMVVGFTTIYAISAYH
jgi:hypothetical protein